jgi:type IV pilus assembly protein PilW
MSNANRNLNPGRPSACQRGLTLVELMVALTLGLMITLAVGTAYVQSSRSTAEDDRYLRMIENGRFALSMVVTDLKMTSFWGELIDPGSITTGVTAEEDCDTDILDAGSAILVNSPNGSPAVTQFDINSTGCAALMGTVRANTMQLVTKHTTGVALETGAVDDVLYLRSNGASGMIIDDAASTAPPAGFADWALDPSLYYVREEAGDLPRLCRLRLAGKGFGAVTNTECVADGIEQLHVEFGLDTDNDGLVNQYKSNPTTTEMGAALTARAWVLVRSDTADPAYTNTKTYQLGDLAVAAANDNFYRRVFSSTVELRNPANLATLR